MEEISRYLTQDSLASHELCGPGQRLQTEAQAVRSAIKGLNLSDFYHTDEIFFPIADEGSLFGYPFICCMCIMITKLEPGLE